MYGVKVFLDNNVDLRDMFFILNNYYIDKKYKKTLIPITKNSDKNNNYNKSNKKKVLKLLKSE